MPHDNDTAALKNSDAMPKNLQEEAELVDKLDRMVRYAMDHPTWVEARKEMQRCHEYNEGQQWSDDELRELKARKQPATVDNLVSFTVNKLVGELVDQRVRIGFRGRNAPADTESASILSDIFLHIRQSNDLEFEERDMARDGFVSGFGVIEAYPTFDDLYQPEIKVRHEDSLIVGPDPDSRRYDWNEDAKYIWRAKWMDADEAKEKYPKIKGRVDELLTDSSIGSIAGGQLASVESFRGDTYVDKDKRRVRMIEVQYKKYKRESILLFADGTVIPEDDPSAKGLTKKADEAGVVWERIDRIKPTIYIGLYSVGMIIDHKVTSRRYFSLIPYFVYRKKNGAPYSLITLALSVQDAINKRNSKALHLLNTNQTVAERNALKDKDQYAEQLALPDGVAIVEDGALSQQKLLLRNNLELAQGQQSMHQSAIQTFFAVTGINPNVFTQTGEIRSGSGLKTKFAEANKPISSIFDNLKRTRKILGRVLLDLVQIYYTGEKVFLVTDNPQSAERAVTVSADQLSKIRQMNYDVVVDDFEDHATVQQEQWALFMQYIPQIINLPLFWQEKIIQTSDLRDRDQMLQELKQTGQPPPLQPRVSVQANIDNLPPNERAFYYALMGNPQLAEEIRQTGGPTTVETKATVDLAKAKIQANSKGASNA